MSQKSTVEVSAKLFGITTVGVVLGMLACVRNPDVFLRDHAPTVLGSLLGAGVLFSVVVWLFFPRVKEKEEEKDDDA